MDYRIETKILDAQPAVVMKGKSKIEDVGPLIGSILGKLESYLAEKKIPPIGSPFTRTFRMEGGFIEFETGFPIKEKTNSNGEIIGTELPKGLVAFTTHIGSQDGSSKAYAAIHKWVDENGKREAGAPWEIYLTDASTPPAQSRMQIYFPIK